MPVTTTITNNSCTNNTNNNTTTKVPSLQTALLSVPHQISVEEMVLPNQFYIILSGNIQPQQHTGMNHRIHPTPTLRTDGSNALQEQHNQIIICIEILLSSIFQYNCNNGRSVHLATQSHTTNQSGLTSLLILASLLSDNDETVRHNVFSTLLRIINQQQPYPTNRTWDVVQITNGGAI
jgi:hypothetical protein